MQINLSKLVSNSGFKYLILQGINTSIMFLAGTLIFLILLFYPGTTVWGVFSYTLTSWLFIFPCCIILTFIEFLISKIIRKDKWTFSVPVMLIMFVIWTSICLIFQWAYYLDNPHISATDVPMLGYVFTFFSLPGFILTFPTLVIIPYLIILFIERKQKLSLEPPPFSGLDKFWFHVKIIGAGIFIFTCLLYIILIVLMIICGIIIAMLYKFFPTLFY